VAEVEVNREGAVLTITLNRPDVLNALNKAVHDQLHAALGRAADPEIRAVVITGAGRGFCVGQDLQDFSAGAGSIADNLRENYHETVLAIRALQKPVIAAVNGPAAGAGMSLALACDVRVASDAASFVPAFIKIGLVPDSGGTWLVRRVLGTARAFEWLTTGRKLSADEARQWGMVSEVTTAEELPARAHEIARLYAAMPTRAVWETKRLLDAAETSTFAEQLELEAVTQAELTRTPDFAEGVAAFLGKRDAEFTGADRAWPHPVHLVVNDDLKRWRLTVAMRWLLALPHLLVLSLWVYLAVPVGIVNWFIHEALHGRTLTVYGEGSQLRDYIHIDDAVQAMLSAGLAPEADGKIYNVGSGHGVSFVEMAEHIIQAAGRGHLKHVDWPADAALVMQLGAEGVFVGSGIFKSGNPAQRARAIVEATTHWQDAERVAQASRGLGPAMASLESAKLDDEQLLAQRGW